MYPLLIESLINSPIVKKGEYNYFVHPVTDGIPFISPSLMREITRGIIRLMDLKDVDYIVTAEAMGIPIGTSLSLITDIPLNIIRKRRYTLPGEYDVSQVTGYSKGEMFINGIKEGDRIVIIDDVISTGGTMNAVITAMNRIGAEIRDICFVIKKGSPSLSIPYKYLVSIEVAESVKILDQST